ncbi:MAG: hypothetical protein AAGH48_03420 [Pseudomonadota bacterium]
MWRKRKKVDPSFLFAETVHPLFGEEQPVRPIPRNRRRPAPPPPEPEVAEEENDVPPPPAAPEPEEDAPPPWDPHKPDWDEDEDVEDEPSPLDGRREPTVEEEPPYDSREAEPEEGPADAPEPRPDVEAEAEPPAPAPRAPDPQPAPAPVPSRPVSDIIEEKKKTRQRLIRSAYDYLREIHREIDWTKFRGMQKPQLGVSDTEVWSTAKVGSDKEVTFFRVGTYEGAYLLKRTALGLVMMRYRTIDGLGQRIIEDLNAVDAF